MKIFNFNKQYGKKVTHFNSDFILSRVMQMTGQAQVSWMHLEENGLIGYHEAKVPQVLLVVKGRGWVRAGEKELKIEAGEAVYWERGEWHETRTESGLTAIAIESADSDPEILTEESGEIRGV
ncbi:cupin domain-containing protein [Alteribacter natronophilus]|uniref:cupin domain-containing protein n=1 Tax=Alteribacter natronophilus TaxID=2583810 RepID=UPI00110E7F7E|nr:cupin domain-containing protein [Alteribacter natronophilus]TMW70368.1 cupin domain-containing protein [Alteribacter natronophilus]